MALFFGWWLLEPPFALREVFSDGFKGSDSTAPCLPVMMLVVKGLSTVLFHRVSEGSPVHDPLYKTRKNCPFIQQVHPNKRQGPAANQLQGFWIPADLDALYALSDTYVHFPQNSISKRGQDLVYKNEKRSSMRRGAKYEDWKRLEFFFNLEKKSIEAEHYIEISD